MYVCIYIYIYIYIVRAPPLPPTAEAKGLVNRRLPRCLKSHSLHDLGSWDAKKHAICVVLSSWDAENHGSCTVLGSWDAENHAICVVLGHWDAQNHAMRGGAHWR